MTPGALGEPQQLAFLADEPAIELVELLHEVLDARVVEAHPLEQLDALEFELVVAALSWPRQNLALT